MKKKHFMCSSTEELGHRRWGGRPRGLPCLGGYHLQELIHMLVWILNQSSPTRKVQGWQHANGRQRHSRAYTLLLQKRKKKAWDGSEWAHVLLTGSVLFLYTLYLRCTGKLTVSSFYIKH